MARFRAMDAAAVPLIRVADLIAEGATRSEIAVRVHDLERLAVGIYAETTNCPDAAERHLLRARAVIGRVGDCVASHVTAAAAWRLPLRAADHGSVQISPVSGRRGNPKRGPGYHFHSRPVEQAEVIQVGALPVTTCNAHGSSRARALATTCSGLAESPGESLLRLRLGRMGLQATEQATLHDVEGQPRVDFVIDGGLVIEFDGESKYTLGGDVAKAHWREKQRHDRIVEAGYEVLRVIWVQLWDEPKLRARVMQALHRADRRGHATHS